MKHILDFGRKKLEIFLEELYLKLEELCEDIEDIEEDDEETKEEIKKRKTILTNKQVLFKSLFKTKEILKELKGKVDFENYIQDIWVDEELKKISNVDKLSFHTLLAYMEELESFLQEYHETNYLLQELLEKENENYLVKKINISQIFFSIDQQNLDEIIYDLVLKERNLIKKEFIEEIMIRFDFILLESRLKMDRNSVKKQNYFVPVLFPNTKPKGIFLQENKIDFSSLHLKKEWTMEYHISFKHSSFWKILFVKLRKICSENQFSMELTSEVYWKDGKLFFFFCY
jgi:hypothetical protein